MKKDQNHKNTKNHNRFNRLVAFLENLNGGDFTGYVKINYTQGCIARIEKFEEVLRKLEKTSSNESIDV